MPVSYTHLIGLYELWVYINNKIISYIGSSTSSWWITMGHTNLCIYYSMRDTFRRAVTQNGNKKRRTNTVSPKNAHAKRKYDKHLDSNYIISSIIYYVRETNGITDKNTKNNLSGITYICIGQCFLILNTRDHTLCVCEGGRV